jgi:predicted DNA-binding transcriptional regulator YafY
LETAAISPKKGEIYKVQSFSQDWLLRNFLSTLGNAKLLGSTDLAEMVADKARATLDLYRSDTFA